MFIERLSKLFLVFNYNIVFITINPPANNKRIVVAIQLPKPNKFARHLNKVSESLYYGNYPKHSTIAALIYQVSLSSQQSHQTHPYFLILRSSFLDKNLSFYQIHR
jgi:hypothetical protein